MKNTSTRRDLLEFLKRPNFDKFQDLSLKAKIGILFKVLILTFIGIIVASLPFHILGGLNIIGEMTNKVDTVFNTMKERDIAYRPYFIFSSIVLVPLLEETAFRLFLTKFRINYFIISVSVISGSLFLHFIGTSLWRPESYLLFSLSTYFYVFIISGVLGLILWLLRNYLIELKKFWDNNTGLIFYSVAILFGMFHFTSINFNGNSLIYAPIILLPFFIYGLSFGYIRVRLGFLYSIALHFIILSIRLGLPELINVLKANQV